LAVLDAGRRRERHRVYVILNWEVELTDSNLNEDPRIADARTLLKALEAGRLGEATPERTQARIHHLRRQIADADARAAQRHAGGR
jgi:hypothetical protein